MVIKNSYSVGFISVGIDISLPFSMLTMVYKPSYNWGAAVCVINHNHSWSCISPSTIKQDSQTTFTMNGLPVSLISTVSPVYMY